MVFVLTFFFSTLTKIAIRTVRSADTGTNTVTVDITDTIPLPTPIPIARKNDVRFARAEAVRSDHYRYRNDNSNGVPIATAVGQHRIPQTCTENQPKGKTITPKRQKDGGPGQNETKNLFGTAP